jgi:hypothetical protein
MKVKTSRNIIAQSIPGTVYSRERNNKSYTDRHKDKGQEPHLHPFGITFSEVQIKVN